MNGISIFKAIQYWLKPFSLNFFSFNDSSFFLGMCRSNKLFLLSSIQQSYFKRSRWSIWIVQNTNLCLISTCKDYEMIKRVKRGEKTSENIWFSYFFLHISSMHLVAMTSSILNGSQSLRYSQKKLGNNSFLHEE